ncbi:cAMP-binding protein [Spirochaetia bacterium]|nr:cAMP-binding protein [Spirochaetia bacterium]
MANRPQLNVVTYNKGTYILVEGKQGSGKFYIVREGLVQLSKESEVVNETGFNTMKPGDFFGIISAISQRSQIESAQALSDVVLLSVDVSEFEGLIQFNTPVAMKIILQFSRRMRFLNDALTKLTSHALNQDDPNVLFKIGDFYKKNAQKEAAFYAFKRYCECYPNGPFVEKAKENTQSLIDFNKPNFTFTKSEFLRTYKKNNIVFAEGETGEDLFIIQAGSVRITKIIDGAEVILAILKQGDIFGEMAILESKPRSASAIAMEDSILMVVQKQNFEGMAATQPQIIKRLTKLLAERIWFSYKQLSNAMIKDPVVRCFNNLLINLEKNNINTDLPEPYGFSFTPEELFKMANIPMTDSRNVLIKMKENAIFSLENNRINISNISELVKISEFYKNKMARAGRMK